MVPAAPSLWPQKFIFVWASGQIVCKTKKDTVNVSSSDLLNLRDNNYLVNKVIYKNIFLEYIRIRVNITDIINDTSIGL